MLMRRRTFPVTAAAVLLGGGLLAACDDGESVQRPVSQAALAESAAGETGRPPESAPHVLHPNSAEDAGEANGDGQNARQPGERAGQRAVEAIETGWEQTKDAARQTGAALARAMGEADEVVVGIWEQAKERARRAGEVIEEMAPETDRILGLAWQHAKDTARQAGEAWRGAVPPDEDDELAGEVRL
jgi:hypothetical protein